MYTEMFIDIIKSSYFGELWNLGLEYWKFNNATELQPQTQGWFLKIGHISITTAATVNYEIAGSKSDQGCEGILNIVFISKISLRTLNDIWNQLWGK